MRTSFWDIVETQANFADEISYIDKTLYHKTFYFEYNHYTLINYIETFYFPSWAAKNKITCPSIADLRLRLNIDNFQHSKQFTIEKFLLYLEFARTTNF